ncbi:tRNA-specific adenosine deaminase [Barrientosiimonas endolithica]|uniref:tRNA-specific adenosine deaminase n=2 Tax=Dermacoccaceae TaxID=145357 RepID=A0ABN6YGC4_9MICO|nr:tRNA-specific adenosine deaminase [Barrientosiimonas endolithica]
MGQTLAVSDLLPGALADRYAAWMTDALAEARAALTTGDVPVGAVVVDADGEVVGAGRNRRTADGDPLAHAEVLALRAAAERRGGWRLDDCTLVVTLEPCAMCAGAVAQARLQRVVLGAWDAKAGAAGSRWDLLRDTRAPHWVEVVGGVRQQECAALLTDFFRARRP